MTPWREVMEAVVQNWRLLVSPRFMAWLMVMVALVLLSDGAQLIADNTIRWAEAAKGKAWDARDRIYPPGAGS